MQYPRAKSRFINKGKARMLMENGCLIDFNKILDYSATLAGDVISSYKYPWEILDTLGDFIKILGKKLQNEGYIEISPNVWVGKDVKISPTAEIAGPCVICEGSEIRHNAYIRGSVLVGKNCVVGNSTELKNCILFDKTQVPHYNYVGDSILGKGSHLGASSVISNLKSDGKNVTINYNGQKLETGRRKFGAILGDGADIGCGSVLNPGSIIGKGSRVYPHSTIRGVVPSHSIYKNENEIVPIID